MRNIKKKLKYEPEDSEEYSVCFTELEKLFCDTGTKKLNFYCFHLEIRFNEYHQKKIPMADLKTFS